MPSAAASENHSSRLWVAVHESQMSCELKGLKTRFQDAVPTRRCSPPAESGRYVSAWGSQVKRRSPAFAGVSCASDDRRRGPGLGHPPPGEQTSQKRKPSAPRPRLDFNSAVTNSSDPTKPCTGRTEVSFPRLQVGAPSVASKMPAETDGPKSSRKGCGVRRSASAAAQGMR